MEILICYVIGSYLIGLIFLTFLEARCTPYKFNHGQVFTLGLIWLLSPFLLACFIGSGMVYSVGRLLYYLVNIKRRLKNGNWIDCNGERGSKQEEAP
jgi:cytochrome bd-type quinol oxidase subunit 2